MPDISGIIIGTICIMLLRFLYLHCDAFADGNVGSDE